ncbi:MAG: NTP/NDP exchange transporter [Chlamydiales bacterium]|nr:NTP/NDP exchange transporter [Chlamydiia bacterium]MCP5507735.1 NTP/NDP exchange transporter [Chlamydiales bacterium]
MSQVTEESQFSKWRSYLWPIYNYELKKLLPMLAIFFLISFNYNILRTMKDAIVVPNAGGAEVIPFIKVWVMFPGSLLMTFLFTRLSNKISRERVFYCLVSGFLFFFLIFTFVLYPLQDAIHPHAFADNMHATLGDNFKGLVAMCRNWSFTLFYAFSELWGNIILMMLFWGFANQVTRLGEAARFYGLFGVGANMSGIIAGQVSAFLSKGDYNPNLPFGATGWEQSMIILIGFITLSGIAAMGIFRWMHANVLNDNRFYDPQDAKKDADVVGKLSLRECISYLLKSRYLISIAVIVLSYNIVINLVEVMWKDQVRELYPSSQDYNYYMSNITTLIGFLATFISLFVSSNLIRKLGWRFAALSTPVILLVTSVLFFGCFFLKKYNSELLMTLVPFSPLALVVGLGTLQNICSRGAKYTVFDATREMAFVPLSPECKLKGKAVAEGVCSRLGKSGGSVIYQSLLLSFGTISASAPVVSGCIIFVIMVWTMATYRLADDFESLTSQGKPVAVPSLDDKGLAEQVV